MKKMLTNILFFVLLSTSIFSQSKKYLDFVLPNLDSKNVKLSDFVGEKVVLLNFWTTWCPYCVREIPELKKYYSEYKDKGLEIVAVNIQESYKQVKNFVSKKGIEYVILLDKDGVVANQYGVRGIPTNILINKDGEIIFAGYTLPSEETIKQILFSKQSQKKSLPSLPKKN